MKTEEQIKKELFRINFIFNFIRNFPNRKFGEIYSSLFELELSRGHFKRILYKMCDSPIPSLFKNKEGNIVKYKINPFGSPNSVDNGKIFTDLKGKYFKGKNFQKKQINLIENHNQIELLESSARGLFLYLTEVGNLSFFFDNFDLNFCLSFYFFNIYAIDPEYRQSIDESLNSKEELKKNYIFMLENLSRYSDNITF